MNGAVVTAETSWCDPARTAMLRVHGTAGKFMSPGEEGASVTKYTPTSYTRESAPVATETVDLTEGVGGLHEHWYDCITAGIQPPLENAWTARHVTEVLLAGLDAGNLGKTVELTTTADMPG